jgi:peptide subunit release factor 1 (eRF1)
MMQNPVREALERLIAAVSNYDRFDDESADEIDAAIDAARAALALPAPQPVAYAMANKATGKVYYCDAIPGKDAPTDKYYVTHPLYVEPPAPAPSEIARDAARIPREPTEAMLRAARNERRKIGKPVANIEARMWQAMYDAAIEQERNA